MNRRTFGKIIAGLFAMPLGFLGGGKPQPKTADTNFVGPLAQFYKATGPPMTATEVLYRRGDVVEARKRFRELHRKGIQTFNPYTET